MNAIPLHARFIVLWQQIQRMCRHAPLMLMTCVCVLCLWVALLGPIWLWSVLLGGVLLSGVWALWQRRGWVGLGVVCSVITLWHGHQARYAVLPEALLDQPLSIEGRVLSLQRYTDYQRATVHIDACHPLASSKENCERLQRVQITVPLSVVLKEGERWRWVVRLKPPHGQANPGLWDTVWRVRRQGIGGVGNVITHSAPQRLATAGWQPSTALHQYIINSGVSPMAQRWLMGMIAGDGSAFDDADWQLFNDTGTTHLVVVSGSHITLAVSAWVMLGQWVVRRIRPTHYRRAVTPRAGAALAGIGYALLAQGGAPAARACVALLPWVLASTSLWRPSRWQLWWLALLGVVVLMPWSLLMPGVWLSFGAVAGLYLMHPAHSEAGPSLWRLLYSHAAITLLMEGALLVMAGRWAPLAFPVNLIAIPWISLLLMPLGLLGALLAWPWPLGAYGCWWLFDQLLAPLCMLLNWAAQQCPSLFVDPRPATAIGVALMAVAVIAMLPCCAWRWRLVLSLGCGVLAMGRAPDPCPPDGSFEMTVLDVGQGQLVELRTHCHRYLFDTGPENRVGRRAIDEVWPAHQIFDGVIVSHGDLDHAGGIPVLRQRHEVGQWWASWVMPALTAETVPSGPVPSVSLCRAGQSWTVDGVRFRFLWPQPDRPLSSVENDRSCVLLVEGKEGRVLLSGDASEQVEQELLSTLDQPISVWVAGHHGSRTSNSRALLIRARPAVMLYSAGYANRYHHPARQTVARVDEVGAQQWNTAVSGAITVHFLPGGDVSIDTQRGYRTVVIRRL